MKEFKELVRDANPLLDIARNYLELPDKGTIKVLCPYHSEKTPSFSLHPSGEYFKCFGCGKIADVFDIVEHFENTDFIGALRFLAQKANIPFPNLPEQENEELLKQIELEKRENELLEATLAIVKQEALSVTPSYLETRGISKEIGEKYEANSCNLTTDFIRSKLNEKGFSDETINKSNILYDSRFFENSLIMPIRMGGKIVTFCSRTLTDRFPKYLYLKEHQRGFLNFDEAKTYSEIIINESPLDTLTLIDHGFLNAVSVGSCLVSNEQISQLKGLNNKLFYPCFDNDDDKGIVDNSGLNGAIHFAKSLKSKIIILPSSEHLKVDVNSYFASGHTSEEFSSLKENAKNVLEVMLSLIPQDLPKLELKEALNKIFVYLLSLEEFDAKNYLRYTVKPYFGFTNDELNDYLKYFKSIKKQAEAEIKKHEGGGDEEDPIKTSFLETAEFIAEEIYNLDLDPPFQFCVFNKETQEITYETQREIGDKIYIPDDSEVVTKELVHLPSGVVFLSEEEINQKIDEYINAFIWIDEKAKFFAKFYAKYSWIYDRHSVTPYLRPSGGPGSGKTRYNDTVGAICYKPIITSGGISEAVIFRIVDEYGPTLVINEFDRLESSERSLFAIILNNGYEKGKPVPRMVGEGNSMHFKFFKVFSPKIFATRDKFQDSALESRIISLESKEYPQDKRNDYPVIINEGLWEWATEIRNILLGYRFQYIANLERARKLVIADLKNQPNSQKLRLLRVSESGLSERSELEKRFLSFTDLEARTRQTFYPLLFILKENEFDQFIVYVREYQKDLIKKRTEELEGLAAIKIIQLYENKGNTVSVSELKLAINNELTIKEEISAQKLGSLLKNRLKIKTDEIGHDNKTYLILDDQVINNLKKRYKASDEESNQTGSQPTLNERDSYQDKANHNPTSSSQEARNTTSIAQELKPCYVCGFINYWKRKDGGIVCAVCHPPIEEQK